MAAFYVGVVMNLVELGNGNTGVSHNTNYPVAVVDSSDAAISGISDIEAGSDALMCSKLMLVKFCVGVSKDSAGQLGNDAIVSSDHPVYVVDGDSSSTHLTGIVQLSSGIDFTCALNNSGNIYCWGKLEA